MNSAVSVNDSHPSQAVTLTRDARPTASAARLHRRTAAWLGGFLLILPLAPTSAAPAPLVPVGVAQQDITPDYPVRLSGFGFRRAESEGVTQRVWAKALVFADDRQGPAVLITADNLCVPDAVTAEIAKRLAAKLGVRRERLAITATHTHTAPMLKDVCPTLFGVPIPPEHQANIDRYTREFIDRLEQVALAAAKDVQPARLEWNLGTVGFAANRRTKGGPVDHDLPLLAVRAPDGQLRALYFSYACHCVTLSHNRISGDWAGYAQELVQADHPETIALASVGCGADSNPDSGVTGDKIEAARRQGRQIADEVKRLLAAGLKPLTEPPAARLTRIDLAFDTPRPRSEWEERAKREDAIGHHARVTLARLDRGEALPEKLNYPIQTWWFGEGLAMVFLPGETVVDYSLRLKREFDRSRLWVNGYANDARCYLPSERILKEGGYEGGGAMIYYDMPQRFAPGLEQKIIDAVHGQVPKSFVAPKGTEGTRPLSPDEALRSFRTRPEFAVELVAAEPLVVDPVAIDWAADGRLWVCEMHDYPTGLDGNWQPGGRVKLLADTDRDGRYDQATLFLDGLPFPTGVTAWGRGVLVCAAPDILYAEDTDNDGKADKVEKLFTGFHTDNYQARVNSLSLGLDNWIYGANGLLGGTIRGEWRAGVLPVRTSGASDFPATTKIQLDIRNRDFRFHPITGAFEPASGLTQQGRVRDDWGNWFGCDNSRLLLHYPTPDHYVRRNPHVPAPDPTVSVPAGPEANRLFPISRLLERFNDPGHANRVTSACGLGLYRDTLLGEELYGNAFTCEPVHNVVHREVLAAQGVGFTSRRAADESASEFLASTDNWFRPAQVRTGPDGALYVADLYRFLIEHPRWIPAARLAQIDVRAGADGGRIYRVVPRGKPLRSIADLTRLDPAALAAALDTDNGTERDRVHTELLIRSAGSSVPPLERLARTSRRPAARVQALSALAGLRSLRPAHVAAALNDSDARVRENAVRLAEPFLTPAGRERAASDRESANALLESLPALADDPDLRVRHQLAFTLGEWNDPRAGQTLARLAQQNLAEPRLRAAVLSSASRHCAEILAAVLQTPEAAPGRRDWIVPLVATAAAQNDDRLLGKVLNAVLPPEGRPPTESHLVALGGLLDALDRRPMTLEDFLSANPGLREAEARFQNVFANAQRLAADASAPAAARANAVKLLGRSRDGASPVELDLLGQLFRGAPDETLRQAAVAALRRQRGPAVAERLLADWPQLAPARRGEIVAFLLARGEWTRALLSAVAAGTVGPAEIALSDRQRLLESADAAVRELAQTAFPARPAAARAEVFQQYQAALASAGTPAKGAEVFARQCASCHALGGVGHEVGPNLAPLRDKDAAYWLQNILDPNAVVEPRYVSYQIETRDDRSLAGIVQAETATSLTLVQGGGATEVILRADLREIRASSLSLMPEGLEQGITPADMADLIAFLKQSGPRKQIAGNEPAPVRAATNGVFLLPASRAEIYGTGLTFESEFKNLGMWHEPGDHAVWQLQVDQGGVFDVHLDFACAESSAGNAFRLEAGRESLAGKVAATGPDWSRYRQVKLGTLKLDAGTQRLTFRPDGSLRRALIDLRTIALAPPGVAPRWPVPAAPLDGLPRDPASIARLILDAAQPAATREAAISANPQFAAAFIVEMTRDLAPGTPAEYQRIPWIWRVAIACGKRNDPGQVKAVADASLPKENEPLRDWQAVVIGGGLINGISQRGVWPAARLREILGDDAAVWGRWQRAIDLAAAMADDAKIPAGTRYDALRMLGVEPWAKRGAHLARYLAKGTHEELQMGAVSGLADIPEAPATEALLQALPGLAARNRQLALEGLLRDSTRVQALLEAIAAGRLEGKLLNPAQREKLVRHPEEAVRLQASRVLQPE